MADLFETPPSENMPTPQGLLGGGTSDWRTWATLGALALSGLGGLGRGARQVAGRAVAPPSFGGGGGALMAAKLREQQGQAEADEFQFVEQSLGQALEQSNGDYAAAIPQFRTLLAQRQIRSPRVAQSTLGLMSALQDKAIKRQQEQAAVGALEGAMQQVNPTDPGSVAAGKIIRFGMKNGIDLSKPGLDIGKLIDQGIHVSITNGIVTHYDTRTGKPIQSGARLIEPQGGAPMQTVRVGPGGEYVAEPTLGGMAPAPERGRTVNQTVPGPEPGTAVFQPVLQGAPELPVLASTPGGKAAWPFIAQRFGFNSPDDLAALPPEQRRAVEAIWGTLAQKAEASTPLTGDAALQARGQGVMDPRLFPLEAQPEVSGPRPGPAPAPGGPAAPAMPAPTGAPQGGIAPPTAQRIAQVLQQQRLAQAAAIAQATEEARNRGEGRSKLHEKAKSYIDLDKGTYISGTLTQDQADALVDQQKAAYVPFEFDRQLITRARPIWGKLARLEEIIKKRDDFFPDVDPKNLPAALAQVGMAKVSAWAKGDLDADAAYIKKSIAPMGAMLNRFSGDTGQVAIAERMLNLESIGSQPMAKKAALALLNELRDTIREGLSNYGIDADAFLSKTKPDTGAAPAPTSAPGRRQVNGRWFKQRPDGKWVPE